MDQNRKDDKKSLSEKQESIKKLISKGKKLGSLSDKEIMDALEERDLESDENDDIYQKCEDIGIEL